MGMLDPLAERVAFLKKLSPAELRRMAHLRASTVIEKELPRSRARVAELERRYPSAGRRELAQRLIDDKKGVAGMVGGISGVFGILSVPADLLVMVWLELVLLTDLATLYKLNLKSTSSKNELMDLFGESNGVGPFTRSSPRALGTIAGILLARGGFTWLGRSVPVAAAPISAWLNNRHVQSVGEAAIHHFEGFGKARRKAADKADAQPGDASGGPA
jgi:hypothetical protein